MRPTCKIAMALAIGCVAMHRDAGAQPALPRSVQASAATGTAQAVVVGPGPLIHTAQVLPLDEQGQLVGAGGPQDQVERAFENLQVALSAGGGSLDKVVKLNVYAADEQAATAVRQALPKIFSGDLKPAVCFVGGRLTHPQALVALDAVATTKIKGDGAAVPRIRGARLWARHSISSHAAVLPGNDRVYISGQAEKGDDPRQAARATLESLRKTLQFLELDLPQVVQVKSFLTPIASAAEVEEEIVRFFGDRPTPPLVFVEWRSNLPIEIELIAAGSRQSPPPQRVEYLTPPGMPASPIFARVTRIWGEQVVFTSGLYGAGTTGEEQVRSIFETLKPLLAESGSDLKHLVKATYYVADDDTSAALGRLRPGYYDPQRPPAASKALVSSVAREGRSITLDMIAVPTVDR